MTRILVFDNYDSFTYNLVHLVEKILHQKVEVYRNDQIALEKVKEFDKIILSPDPGRASRAGFVCAGQEYVHPPESALGVCLGHQAIGEAFGGNLVNLSTVYHGVATPIFAGGQRSALFEGVSAGFEAGRYHSWVVSDEGFPEELEVTARDANEYIMGLQHKRFDVQGVQFHPESVLTPEGERIMRNWLKQ